jgi:hypothetical protein
VQLRQRRGRLVDVKQLAADTPPEIEAIIIDGYRRMSPREKLERVRELGQAAQQMALLRIDKQYPGATARERQLRLAALWLSREQMIAAFGWDPDREGY